MSQDGGSSETVDMARQFRFAEGALDSRFGEKGEAAILPARLLLFLILLGLMTATDHVKIK